MTEPDEFIDNSVALLVEGVPYHTWRQNLGAHSGRVRPTPVARRINTGYSENPLTDQEIIVPMKAVLFTESNFHLIIKEMHLPLDTVMDREKKHSAAPSTNYYFIPDYITRDGYPYNSWVLIEEDELIDQFTFDSARIRIQFVTITRK